MRTKMIWAAAMLVAGVALGANPPGIIPPSGFTPTTNAPGTNAMSVVTPEAIRVVRTHEDGTIYYPSNFWEANSASAGLLQAMADRANTNGDFNGSFTGGGSGLTNVAARRLQYAPANVNPQSGLRTVFRKLYNKQVAKVGVGGDLQSENVVNNIRSALLNYMPQVGFAGADGGRAFFGTNGLGTYLTFDSHYWTYHYHMVNGALATGGGLTWPATKLGIYYVKDPSYGSLTVETNRNGGTWGTIGTITATGAADGGYTEYALPRDDGYNWRVTSTGNNTFLFASLWDDTGPGFRLSYLTLANNQVLDNYAAVSSNIFYTIFHNLDLDVFSITAFDSAAQEATDLPILKARWAVACPNMDVALSMPPQIGPDNSDQIAMYRSFAETNGWYWDDYNYQAFLPTNKTWVADGFFSDSTHPLPLGLMFGARDFLRNMGMDATTLRAMGYRSRDLLGAYKVASTTRTSTTTLADDPDLQVLLDYNCSYAIEINLLSTVASATPGQKVAIVYPPIVSQSGSAIIRQATNGGAQDNPTFYPFYGSWDMPSPLVPAAQSGGGWRQIAMSFKTAQPGWLKVQWAQNTSSADGTWMLGGSYIVVRKLN